MRRFTLVAIAAVALTASFDRPARAEAPSVRSSVVHVGGIAPAGVLGELAVEPSCSKSPVLCCSDAPLVAMETDRHRAVDVTMRAGEVDMASGAASSDHRVDRTRTTTHDAHHSRSLRARRTSYAMTKGALRRVKTFRRMEPHEVLSQMLFKRERPGGHGSRCSDPTIRTV